MELRTQYARIFTVPMWIWQGALSDFCEQGNEYFSFVKQRIYRLAERLPTFEERACAMRTYIHRSMNRWIWNCLR